VSDRLVHPIPLVVGLVCHYQSPAAIFEFVSRGRSTSIVRPMDWPERGPRLVGILMRKRQAAISGRGRTASNPDEKCGFLLLYHLCEAYD
jgi:hypothetical protein